MGYLGWDSRYLSSVPHLDGVEWTEQGHPLGMTWRETEEDEPFLIQTASGESVVQSVFSGVASSDKPTRVIFDLPFQLINEDSFRRLKMAAARRAEAATWASLSLASGSMAAAASMTPAVDKASHSPARIFGSGSRR